MYLTFDWDDVEYDEPIVQTAMKELQHRYGFGNDWYRISSSGEGIHVIIANLLWNGNLGIMEITPQEFENEFTLTIRKEFSEPPWGLECKGRLISDSVRTKNGFRTGRIFSAKNDKSAGEWLAYV